MNEQQIRQLFPRGSKSFFDANVGLCATQRKQNQGTALDGETRGETKGHGRIGLHIIMYRVRLLDRDNAYASTKILTDCLCEIGLIHGDSEMEIDLKVSQVKVNHLYEQRTEVKIIR